MSSEMKESVGLQGPASEVVRNALIALAVRCETEEPSREIDCHIALAMGFGERGVGHRGSYKHPIRVTLAELMADPSDLRLMVDDGDVPEETIPRFTASLDAAASLMVPGAMMRNTRQHEGIWMVRYVHPLVGGNAATEPMARCAAALRARAEIGR